MPEGPETSTAARLVPLPYHEAIRAYLKQEEAEIWQWYTSHQVRQEQAEAVRFELLKSTYRIEAATQPGLYEAAKQVGCQLGLQVPLTLYQAQNPTGLNASLAYVPQEAHIVLHGPVTSKLNDAELRALLAHELSHLVLWQGWDGEYLVVDQILAALTHDQLAERAHFATARLFGLYNEIFCDRGALLVTGDPLVVVAMLVKVSTDLEQVSAESYLRQAEEVFRNRQATRSQEWTHPESFIRARALQLWSDGDAEAERKIQEMIEGQPVLAELDLLAQQRVAGLTRRLLGAMLAPSWMRSEAVMAHARLFFDDDQAPGRESGSGDLSALARDLRTDDPHLQDYYCFVLLDFVTSDRDLEELPLAAALQLAEQLDLKERFSAIARRELRLRKKQLEKIDQSKRELLARAGGEAIG